MEPDRWPLDRAIAFERVRSIIRQLDIQTEEDSVDLLSEFMCAAWASVTAQNQ